MSKLSIIIPARNELYLQQTIDDIFKKASGDIEVIVILDGYWPKSPLKENQNLTYIHRERRGMRAAINTGVQISRGKYIMKMDAHCLFAEGFDEVLKSECEDNWVVIPRRYSIEPTDWSLRTSRPFVDYEYLGWPWDGRKIVHGDIVGLHARPWENRQKERMDIQIDENMTFQGSLWFMTKEHYTNRIGWLHEEGYGTFIGEPQEIGLKTWLGGGKVMTNKKTWYGHLWKGHPYREAYLKEFGVAYTRIGFHELKNGNAFSVDYWIHDKWKDRIHDISWLIERFWPVPYWPEDRNTWIPQ